MSGWPPAGEMIELRALRPPPPPPPTPPLDVDPPRAAPRLERANAVRIAPGKVPEILSRVRRVRLLGGQSEPRLTEERGRGHRFRPAAARRPPAAAWCDLCGELIWGAAKKRLQCRRE